MKYFALLLLGFFLILPQQLIAAEISDCDADAFPQCKCYGLTYDPIDLQDPTADLDEVCRSTCETISSIGTFGTAERYGIQCKVDGILSVVSYNLIQSLEETEEGEGADLGAAPKLGIDIPGLEFKENDNGNYIGLYVQAIFSWSLVLGILIAVLMFMVAGLQWMMARGDASKISQAKDRMQNAAVGLAILLGAYTIGFLIDPNTTIFSSLEIDHVDPVEYIEQSQDTPGILGISPGDARIPAGVLCDTAGEHSVYEIALSTVGNVTYRYGAKGGTPAYTKGDGTNWSTRTNASGIPFSTYCPEDTLCIDCSGYVDFLAACADLDPVALGGGTTGIFDSARAEQITTCTDTSVNGQTLQEGDLIGWNGNGHVWMYIGNGVVADSHGSAQRTPGEAIGIYNTSWACNRYKDRDHGLFLVTRDE
jgi:hypothetical protein